LRLNEIATAVNLRYWRAISHFILTKNSKWGLRSLLGAYAIHLE